VAAAGATTATSAQGSKTLAKTGIDTSLVPLAVLLLVAGLLMFRRRKTS
jgi:LPXTG-motif cell wall-anchored protein